MCVGPGGGGGGVLQPRAFGFLQTVVVVPMVLVPNYNLALI